MDVPFFFFSPFVFEAAKKISSPTFMALLEVELLECEVSLHDAGGLDAGSQHVLLSGDVVGLGYPFQVVQVAEGGRGDDVSALFDIADAPQGARSQ